jgi:hypothetical protein
MLSQSVLQQKESPRQTVSTHGSQEGSKAAPVTQTLWAHVDVPHSGSPHTAATSFTHTGPHWLLQHEGFAAQIIVTQGSQFFASLTPVVHRLCAQAAPLEELAEELELEDVLLDDEDEDVDEVEEDEVDEVDDELDEIDDEEELAPLLDEALLVDKAPDAPLELVDVGPAVEALL